MHKGCAENDCIVNIFLAVVKINYSISYRLDSMDHQQKLTLSFENLRIEPILKKVSRISLHAFPLHKYYTILHYNPDHDVIEYFLSDIII